MNNSVVITSAVRTAVGSLGKSLKNISAHELGSTVIKSAIKNSKIINNEVDEIILGQVLTGGMGQNPARQAAIESGIPEEKPAYIVNQVCGSGIRSVASGFQSIKSGDAKIVVAGGQENMSLAPHAIFLRDGKKLGNAELIDTMIKDGLWDAFNGYHMGVTAENVAEKFQVTREQQDKFALNSQDKALLAQKNNKFKDEIVNFKIKSKKAEIDFFKDEHPREGINLETLSRLNPVFKNNGTLGNDTYNTIGFDITTKYTLAANDIHTLAFSYENNKLVLYQITDNKYIKITESLSTFTSSSLKITFAGLYTNNITAKLPSITRRPNVYHFIHRYYTINDYHWNDGIKYRSVVKSNEALTVGKKFILSLPFIDSDEAIETLSHKSIAELFEAEGEAGFRQIESNWIKENGHRLAVIALGGGAYCSEINQSHIQKNGKSIYLSLPPAVLVERLLKDNTNRPLIESEKSDAEQLYQYIRKLLRQREEHYLKADHVLNGDCPVEKLVEKMIRILESEGMA